MQSLADIYPDQVEKYAIDFWYRQKYDADEYQKMMVLYSLNKVKSKLLEKYLHEAANTNYEYLKKYADKLKKLKNTK